LPFARRGSVVNAGTFEGFAPLGLQTMVIRARRDDDALRQQGGVAALDLQARAVLAVGKCKRERLRGRRKLGAETIGLKLRAVSQLAAADVWAALLYRSLTTCKISSDFILLTP